MVGATTGSAAGKPSAADVPRALLNEAIALHQGGQIDQAATLYHRLLETNPKDPQVLYLLGTAHLQSSRYHDSVRRLTEAQALAPDQPGICANLGAALAGQGRFDEAVLQYDRALRLQPAAPETWKKRAAALREQGRFVEALADCDRALTLAPRDASAHLDRGVVLMQLKRSSEALESFNEALSIVPDYFEALYNRAILLASLRNYGQAAESYEAALRLRPQDQTLKAALLVNRAYLCDWRDRDALLAETAAGVMRGTTLLDAFESLALYDDPILHKICAARMSGLGREHGA